MRLAESTRRGQRYPPLLAAGIVLLLMLAVLPSALNLPQSNPTQTLEYAPIPPDDSAVLPRGNNLASLGLSGSSTVMSDGLDQEQSAAGTGRGATSSVKKCVGKPPRQTNDLLSPPCVATFDGDNFGATYQGVTRSEVRIIVIVEGFSSCGAARGCTDSRPNKEYVDLAQPSRDDEHSTLRYVRAWQRYFNDRYQTYGRFVHFWAYYPQSSTPEERRSDAAEAYVRIKPFAVVWPFPVPNIDIYNNFVADRGVMTFTGAFGLRADSFRKHPKLSWGYLPSLEEHARVASAYICEKVAAHPVEFSGNATENGKPRRYGLLYTTQASHPAPEFVNLVRPQISKCGVEFTETRTHPYSDFIVDSRTTPDYAAEAMAAFQEKKVTTVLWLLGYDTNFSKAAAAINYRPEWILAGDGYSEGLWAGQAEEQSVWDHAVTLTLNTKTRFGGISPPCEDAYLEADPTVPRETFDMAISCFFYNGLRQLFTGIQVAGPRLGPTSVDRGYHALPKIPSADPTVPACFYSVGDYTCVKDAAVYWYDSRYQDEGSSNTQGCWRLMEGGKRYLSGGWPVGNVGAQKRVTDPCNGFLGGISIA